MSIQRKSAFLTYGIAVFSVVTALMIRMLCWPIFQADAPFLFFIASVAVTAWCGGFGPGALATALSAPLVAYYLLAVRGHVRIFEPSHVVHLGIFILIGFLISWLTENLHEARRRSEEAGQEARKLAAEADEGKRILDALMECIPEGIVIAQGPNLEKRMVSDFGQGLTGWPRTALESVPLEEHLEAWKIYHPEGRNPAVPGEFPLHRVTRRGETIRGEEWILRQADGTFLPVLCNGGPIRDKHGNIIGGVTAWSDITEVNKAHEEVLLRDERFRVALECKGISVFTQDDKQRYTWVYAPPDALPADALLGRTDSEIFPAGEAELLTGIKQKVIQTGIGERHVVDATVGGERRNYDLIVDPVRTSEGKIIGILGSAEDITDRRRMEEALQRVHANLEVRVAERTAALAQANRQLEMERNRLTDILGSMPDGVYIAGRNHEIEYANPALEKHLGSVQAWRSNQHSHNQQDARPWCKNPEVFSGKSVRWQWTSSKTGRVYDIFDTPILNPRGATSKLGIMHDITDLKRAEEERERKHRQLESLWNISRKTDADLGSFHDYVLTEMAAISESPCGFLGHVNEDQSALIVRSWSGEATGDFRTPGRPVEFPLTQDGILSEAIHNKRFLIINNRLSEAPYAGRFPQDQLQLERLLLVPVRSQGRIVLLGAVGNKQNDYTDEDAKQVHAFLSSALVAMEKKKAEEALRVSKIQLQRLSSELLTAQEAERTRISRELHDELGQSLTLIKMRVGLVEMNLAPDQKQLREHCESAFSQIDQVIAFARKMSRDLRPAALDDLGITAALQRLASDAMKASNIEVSTEIDNIDSLFSPQSSILLYRVLQETLTNVMKHSKATRVLISAKRNNGRVSFQVEDNGLGMDLEQIETGRKSGERGLGLAIMAERVRTLGAALEISSQKGKGARLRFSVPVKQEESR